MNKIETYGQIKQGKLSIVRRQLFVESLQTLTNGRYRVSIEKLYRKRSNPQNAYLWGVVYPLVLQGFNQVGYNLIDNEEVHSFCKNRFLKKMLVSDSGEMFETIGSTRKLTTMEFNEYIENIKQFAYEYLNMNIPEPNEEMEEYVL